MTKIAILLVVLLCFRGTSQTSCGTDLLHQQLLKNDPDYASKEKVFNQRLYRHLSSQQQRGVQTVLTIPVVVHIIHQNGPENLSDAQVIAGINQLNQRFQNSAPYFDASGVNVGIQFCLASVDPAGQPTTGITRNVSVQTDLGVPGTNDLAMKNLNRWDPYLYLNIWIIKSTGQSTVAGYATYPMSMGTGHDGIVLQYNYFAAYQLSHEAGHYLGLYHTFNSGNCVNRNCMLDGDFVCDTPPDITSDFTCPINSCSTDQDDTTGLSPFTSDVNDAPNYMDYSNCPLSFTPGQSSRMNAALIQDRGTLLQSNGCGQHPGGPIPVASFSSGPICGGTLLTNTSVNGVGAQWDFNSDGQIDDSGNSLTWNPPSTGNYTVTMYVDGIGGTDTLTQVVFGQHYPYQNYPMNNGFGGVNNSTILGGLAACVGGTVSFFGTPGMAHYLWSTGDTTQNLIFIQNNSPHTISLTTIDSAGNTWSTCYPIHFESAPATIPPVITLDPSDTVFCIGQPLNLSMTYSPLWQSGSLFYSGGGNMPFHSAAYNSIVGLGNFYQLHQTDSNGCMSVSNIINVTGQNPTYPNYIQQFGSTLSYGPGLSFQWYLDGNPIDSAINSSYTPTTTGCYTVFSWWAGPRACGSFALDTVCVAFAGFEKNELQDGDILIAPNPFSGHTTLLFSKEQKNTCVKMKDAVGRELKRYSANGKQQTIEMTGAAAGVYILEISNGTGRPIHKKLVIE